MIGPTTERWHEEAAALFERIPAGQWHSYAEPLRVAKERGLRFAIGGGFAYSLYAGRWRDTKDLDLFVLPQDRQAMIQTVLDLAYSDYYEQLPYDRGWLFRGTRDGVIVDVIWQMANRRAEVDERWITRGPEIAVRGLELRFLPLEELIWSKLYVLQRDRSDWPDLLNLLAAGGASLDWGLLLDRVGEDAALLGGVMSVLAWMWGAKAKEMPVWIWDRLGLIAPGSRTGANRLSDGCRAATLDSRDWFGPQPQGE